MPDSNQFPTQTEGLEAAKGPEVVELADNEEFELTIAPVVKDIGDAKVRMLAYNGSIPGPTLRVAEGSEIAVKVVNEGDMEGTVHWHGLRLENRYDGTHETQTPIPVGGSFTARVAFPDPGIYWYHPHIREDYGQEMGLYGNVIVEPSDSDYWPPVHRELALTLDDILIENGQVAPFNRSEATHSAMGRFGNVLLVNGETDLTLTAKRCEVVRFYFTNTANTRVFKVKLPGARMKLVGGDSGHVEHETLVDEVIVAPSERVVVDVLFPDSGNLALEHHTPGRVYPLASIRVADDLAEPPLAAEFETLRSNADLVAERKRISEDLDREPDKVLAFIAEMDMGAVEGDDPVVFSCPMHPEVVQEESGSCPECGMKLMAVVASFTCPMHPEVISGEAGHCPECGMKLMAVKASFTCPMHPEVVSSEPGHCPECQMKLVPSQLVGSTGESHHHDHSVADAGHHHEHSTADGIEWEDDMVDVNRLTTPANMRWKLIDRETDSANHEINWRFQVGDRVKIRLLNEMAGDHPMHHPFHIHGAGRFLVLARDGEVEPNLVWTDTVLIPAGQTVDILLDVTNPGLWMAHCHIAEHHESGMMFSFDVAPSG